MSSYMSQVVTGSVYPGTIDPRIKRKWITDYPYGPPIKPERITQPQIAKPGERSSVGQVKHIGDEHHLDMANLLKKLVISQKTEQITTALPRHRDWR